MTVDVEKAPDKRAKTISRLRLVILESILVRRDTMSDSSHGSTHTELQVEDGVSVKAGDVVATTQILCKQAGLAQLPEATEAEPVRRMIVERPEDTTTLTTSGTPVVTVGQRIVDGDLLADGEPASCCGEVEKVEGNAVTLRLGRPYMVSLIRCCTCATNWCSAEMAALLVFERQKTGDIVQGLPQLRSCSKPSPRGIFGALQKPGTVEIKQDDESITVTVIEADDAIGEYPILLGRNVMVSNGQQVTAGELLTDGPVSAHELLECFFEDLRSRKPRWKRLRRPSPTCSTVWSLRCRTSTNLRASPLMTSTSR